MTVIDEHETAESAELREFPAAGAVDSWPSARPRAGARDDEGVAFEARAADLTQKQFQAALADAGLDPRQRAQGRHPVEHHRLTSAARSASSST